MSNPLDTDAGSELFSSYEAEFKLVQADLNQKLDQIEESMGEQRKASIRQAERALEEAKELLDQMKMEKSNIPTSSRQKAGVVLRNASQDLDNLKRRLTNASQDKVAVFGERYTDDEPAGDMHLEQRQQLLSGTERLGRSSQRLRDSQRIAQDTEQIGQSTLLELGRQREQIEHTRDGLLESESYVDRGVKTLREMSRRMATNRLITIAIITVLVLLIIGVIWSKFH